MKKFKDVWFLSVLLIVAVLIMLFLIRGCKRVDSQNLTTTQTEIQTVPEVIEEKIQSKLIQKHFAYIPLLFSENPSKTFTFVLFCSVISKGKNEVLI